MMALENRTSPIHRDPPPIEIGVQKVILYGNNGSEGWKAVIECPDGNSNDCEGNHKFSGLVAGINEQRRQGTLRRMGIK